MSGVPILAWRGREREVLLTNLQAARSPGRPAADRIGRPGVPLADCVGSYFALQGVVTAAHPAPTAPAAVLAGLAPVALTVRRHALVDLLRPAYEALGSPSDPG